MGWSSGMGLVRFSSADLPERSRASRYRDLLNSVLRLDLESLDGEPIEVNASLRRLPGMVVASSTMSALAMHHTVAHAADGNDDLVLSIPLVGRAGYRQRASDDVVVDPGAAYLLLNDEASVIKNGRMARLSLALPRAELLARVRSLDSALGQPIPATPALRHLIDYVLMLTRDTGDMPFELERIAAAHVLDLAALALGATPSAVEQAHLGGIKAARFSALKQDIDARLADPEMRLAEVAARQGISPQYARALFNAEGTTFTDFVVKARLARVRNALSSQRHSNLTVSAIAFSCGFGDLSYFNRVFRRAYGMTPSEARAGALDSETD
jgi:AraC-like DNA-binding protein